MAGVSLLVQPFWEPIVAAAVSKYLEIEVNELPGPGWGLALIIVAFVYHYLTLRAQALDQRLTSERVRAHDQPIVDRLNAEYPHVDLENLIGSIGADHSYFLDKNSLDRFAAALRDPANRFLDRPLAATAEALADSAARLGLFLQQHFFVYGPGQRLRLVMYPDLNEDRSERGYVTPEQRGQYKDYARQLHSLLEEVEATHAEFVIQSHHRLA